MDPYLSVVATARNDNHGGDLLHRMQTFVNALAAQCVRHRVPSELVLVEWNPPRDRSRLTEALEWPEPSPWLSARVVTVPPEVHSRLRYAERLPLFQMIAKNVGIRRARGEFVLATNVDLVFSDELMAFLARRPLERSRLYRVDRYDADPADLDPRSSVDDQLRACNESLIRICKREGTIDLRTGEFFRIYEEQGLLERWLAHELQQRRHGSRVVVKVLHQVVFADRLARVATLRTLERIQFWTLLLLQRAEAFGIGMMRLALRLVRLVSPEARERARRRLVRRRWPAFRLRLARRRWAAFRRRRPRPPVDRPPTHALLAVPLAIRKAARAVRARTTRSREAVLIRLVALRQAWEWDRARVRLHTNACGDFTLLDRASWFRTRAYPELEIFSMHLDSLFLYQAHYAGMSERFLPYRVYHLEHGAGFKPDDEGLKALAGRLERDAIPQVSNEQFLEWALEMFMTRQPIVFNSERWGLVDEHIPEHEVVSRVAAARKEVPA